MSTLKPPRILILEEQKAVALLLKRMVHDCGYEVVGPAPSISQALALIEKDEVDVAILDVKIKGQPTFAVAEELFRRGLPWAFASGNNADEFIARYPGVPSIVKPYTSEHICSVLGDLLGH